MTDTNRAYILPAKSTDWETPPELFDKLWDEVGGFDLDPCCSPEQYSATRVLYKRGKVYISPDHYCVESLKQEPIEDILVDGLAQPWFGKVFMNPPYGKGEGDWIARAYNETQSGNTDLVVGLLPVRTDTIRWHKYIHNKAEIRFLKGRLTFVGAPASAPFPSCLVIWRKP